MPATGAKKATLAERVATNGREVLRAAILKEKEAKIISPDAGKLLGTYLVGIAGMAAVDL
jgi:hypothetical protein